MSDAPSRPRPLPGSLSVSMRPARAGAAGTLRWVPGHRSSGAMEGTGHGMAVGRGDTPSHWLPAVRDRSLSEPKSILSLNNTRWPTRRHARHVTPRAAPPPGPPTSPPRSLPDLQLPTTSFPSSMARPSTRTRPFLRPGCRAGRGWSRSSAGAQWGLWLPFPFPPPQP